MLGTGILRDDQGVLWLGRAGEEEYGRRHFMELCQAMRDVLQGCDLPATISRRASAALDDLRQDFAWLEAGSTAVVHSADASRWWTFGGLYANAALAAGLQACGLAATPNNLAIRFGDVTSASAVEQAVRAMRESDPEARVPEVSQKTIDGLKFSACLPPELATHVLQTRMRDVGAVERVTRPPLRVIRA